MRELQMLAFVAATTMYLISTGPIRAEDRTSPPTRSTDAAYGIPAGFTSHFATANGVKLHYVIGGSGSPILLIHGWPEDWYEWRTVMPIFAQHHTVVAVDMRGFGASEITDSGYDRRSLAEDLYQLMRQVGYDKATVVGHDWGGPVAYAYAATHREAVDKLVIAEGPPDGPWTKQQRAPFLHNPLWFFGFFEIPNFAETVLAGHEKEFLDWFYRNKEFHIVPGAFSDADIAYYEGVYAEPGRLAASVKLYRTIDQDIIDNSKLSQTPLAIPVLAVGARHGIGPGVADAVNRIASSVDPVIMEDTGHFLVEERPSEFSRIVEDFLEGKQVPPVWRPAATSR
jgi:pimeloyl-ACP methyl ester carboxylesterase